jgi:cytosine/adenosine deaminase-related metal-dependent hydrolase
MGTGSEYALLLICILKTNNMSVCLKNATFINWKTFEFTKANIMVEEGDNGRILILPVDSKIPDDNTVLDCSGLFVTKSFANGHHHVYSALAKGMPALAQNPANFVEILKYVWWKLDQCLDLEMIRISALVTAIECAKNGVTFVIDHHSSPNAITGSLDVIAKAFDQVGISHLLCYEISDRDGASKCNLAFDETDNYLHHHQGLVGLHASFTVGDKTFAQAISLADKHSTGIHIHVAEDDFDQKQCEQQYQKTVIKRIASFGGLNSSRSILVHCLHLADTERKAIKNSGVWIAQNTESNLNNQVGFFNSVGLGDNIMLGTDGMHSDMLRAVKASYFTGVNYDKIDMPGIYNRFRNTQRYLLQNNFNGNADNNLVVLDYNPPTDFQPANFLGHFLYGIESKHIKHVISNGKLIVRDRKMQTIDEDAVFTESRKLSMHLWNKMGKL